MKHQIPNALTVLRFLLVPVFIYYLFVAVLPGRIFTATLIFIVASLTDYLDGLLARKMNVISDFGKIMDPLADKLLVLSALAGLCWLPPFQISKIVFFIVLIRELLITLLREIYQRKGIVVAADKLGKLKTVLQMIGIIAALGLWSFTTNLSVGLRLAFDLWFWMIALVTVISGINYIHVLYKRR
jgi:CDP-diacylglycerol--glycerol-3-phosphate 3-phosphatidyltransferase